MDKIIDFLNFDWHYVNFMDNVIPEVIKNLNGCSVKDNNERFKLGEPWCFHGYSSKNLNKNSNIFYGYYIKDLSIDEYNIQENQIYVGLNSNFLEEEINKTSEIDDNKKNEYFFSVGIPYEKCVNGSDFNDGNWYYFAIGINLLNDKDEFINIVGDIIKDHYQAFSENTTKLK